MPPVQDFCSCSIISLLCFFAFHARKYLLTSVPVTLHVSIQHRLATTPTNDRSTESLSYPPFATPQVEEKDTIAAQLDTYPALQCVPSYSLLLASNLSPVYRLQLVVWCTTQTQVG